MNNGKWETHSDFTSYTINTTTKGRPRKTYYSDDSVQGIKGGGILCSTKGEIQH